MQKPPPFRTQNRQLAFALACSGCQFATLDVDGPAVNTYSIGFLRQPRFAALLKGKGIEEAALELINRKIPGHVDYVFIRNDLLNQCLAAWDGVVEEFQLAEQEGRAPELPQIGADVVMKVLCVASHSQDAFHEVPFVNKQRQMVSTVTGNTKDVPLTDKKGVEKPAPRKVTQGKGKVWTIGASKETRERLKIK